MSTLALRASAAGAVAGAAMADAPRTEVWRPGMPVRPCGGCTMCCKVAAVPETDKPTGAWCQHCDKGKGCRMYEQRPEACRDFYCLWKVMPDFPEELRPDRCKVMWTMTGDGKVAVATTDYHEALRSGRQGRLVQNFHCVGIAVVVRSPAGQIRRVWPAPGKGRDDVGRSL